MIFVETIVSIYQASTFFWLLYEEIQFGEGLGNAWGMLRGGLGTSRRKTLEIAGQTTTSTVLQSCQTALRNHLYVCVYVCMYVRMYVEAQSGTERP